MNKYKLDIQLFATVEQAIEQLSEKEFMNYARRTPLKPFLGDSLFPDKKTSSLTGYFIANQNLLPKSAHIHAFDTKGHLMSRDNFASFEFKKILIKEQMSISEEAMVKLYQPRSIMEFDETIEQIYDDSTNLRVAVKTRAERMKMDVLANGEIVVNENNVNYVLDYGVPSTHKATLSTATTKWSDKTNSDPIGDIQAWSDKILEDTGVRPSRALTSTKVLRLIQGNANVQLAINGENFKSKTITLSALNSYMQEMGLPTIVTYDEKYRYENVDGTETQARFFPENKFVMFPENLGNGLYGYTPTEIRRVKGDDVKDMQSENIHITVREEIDPVVTITKAEAVFIPTFPAYNEVFQAKVID